MSENDLPSHSNTSPPATENDAISNALGKLLEHPELISMVASALGGENPQKALSDAPSSPQNILPPAEEISNALSSISPILSKQEGGAINFRHAQLLRALKPYLSESRAEAIDYVIRISQLSSLLGGSKK